MVTSNLSLSLAFLAGIASFLSPCVFCLVPAYLGYLGGRSAASARAGHYNRLLALTHALAFVVGFSLVFISLGVASSALGGYLFGLKTWLAKIGGVVIVIFGLHMTGLLRIPYLEYDLRPQTIPHRRYGYLASLMMGVFFSAGWSPCVGPVLGAILTLAFNGGSITQGVVLLSAYSAGLAIPFLLASTQIGLITAAVQRYGKLMRYAEILMGIVLIIIGVLLFLGRFEQIASYGLFFTSVDELKEGRFLLLVFTLLGLLGLIPALIASRKGRDFVEWWFFGASLFPIAFFFALYIKPHNPESPGP